MTEGEIEDLIIELLAAEAQRDPDDLRRELRNAGPSMPVDSLLAAEVLTEVEERCRVSLPATAETAKNLRSVSTFAHAIWTILHEQIMEST
jgi:acyl carrier protein